MTYSSGGLIQATDYNGFVSTTSGANVNATWNTAYGQTALSTVAAGGTVTATQWATLNSTISSMASHQGTSITSRSNPTTGTTISVLAALNTDIGSCYTNRLNAASQGTQYSVLSGSPSKTSTTGSGTSAWSITFTSAVAFANTTAATNFFNAGGLIKIQFGKTSTGQSTSDAEWNSFVGSSGAGGVCAGAIWLSSDGASKTINGSTYTGTTKTGGSGSPTTLATSVGFNQLTGSNQTLYLQYDSGSAYSSNYVQVQALYSGSTITITTTWYESGGGGSSGSAIAGGSDTTGNPISWGTAPTTLVTYVPPETTNLTNTWGTPTITNSVA